MISLFNRWLAWRRKKRILRLRQDIAGWNASLDIWEHTSEPGRPNTKNGLVISRIESLCSKIARAQVELESLTSSERR